jgi:hypothetical protein
MQRGRSSHSNGLKESAPHSRRALAAREALRRVTLELLQSQHTQQSYSTPETCSLPDTILNDGDTIESAPAQSSDQSVAEQKTRLLGAIQPVLEVVADSALHHSDSHNSQL